ncbi:MAG: trigger factor [Polyangiaceae bacterium]|nr:trigger factor [Polyangiaceae bacterium]
MQVNVQRLSPVLVEFNVEVGADRVRAEVDKAFSTLAKSAKVKGFRPGKAPRRVLSHMFGSRVAADVAQRLVDETFQTAVAEQKLQPVSSPAFEPQKLEDNKSFTYKARFEVLPTIQSVAYEGLSAKRPRVAATDEQIAAELEQVRRAHSTLEAPPEPRPVQEGDVVTIDVSVEVGGRVVEEGSAKDFQADLGSGNLLPEIAQVLLGQSIGATVATHADLPARHPIAQLRGAHAHFQITVKDIKTRVLPALDDELAKDIGEFETFEQLKEHVKVGVEKGLKEQAENALAEQLVVELVKANPIPVPQALVEQQSRVTEEEILARARAQGNEARTLGSDLRAKVRTDSEVKVRAGLLMAEIAKLKGIRIGNKEIEEALVELAAQTGKNVARLKAEYAEPKQREMLIGMILENKVLDIIEASAKIEES